MSRHSMEKITCPKCGCESDFMIWSSINTVLDPEMFEKVRTGEAFAFTCPECGHTAGVEYGCLYHQMNDEMMIYYVPDPDGVEKAYDMFRGDSKVSELMGKMQDNYLYRIVQSKNELREKLFIFDAGLDDRAIEIIKVFYAQKLREDNPEISVDEIRFEAGENDEIGLVFIAEGRPVASCQIGREFYDIIMVEYVSKMPDIRKDEIIIDWDWAVDVFRNKE